MFGLQISHARVDGLAHVVLHVLQVGEGYVDVIGFGALFSAFGKDESGGRSGVRWRRGGYFDDVALTDGAFLTGCVDEIEVGAGDEDVGLVVAEHAGNSAGGGVDVFLLGVGCGFGVFKCDLTLDLVGDHLLDLWGEYGRTAGCCDCLGLGVCCLGGVDCLKAGGDEVIGEPEGGAGIDGVGCEVRAVEAVPGRGAPSPGVGDGSGPGIIGPAVEAYGIVAGGGVDVEIAAAVAVVAVVIAVVGAAVIVVGAMAELAAVVHVGVLNVATAPVLGIDAGVVGAFDRDATVRGSCGLISLSQRGCECKAIRDEAGLRRTGWLEFH